ncbi:MAG: hypothetical protein IJB43_09195 [Clostridia bacterium]|nr:hypothetical protein [Clostridia bacterium]
MATSTIKPKCGTTAQWQASGRILEVNEWGVEVTESGAYILRIGDGEHLFHDLPAVIDVPTFDALVQQVQEQYNEVIAFRNNMTEATNAANSAAAGARSAADAANAGAAACENIAAGINSMADDTTATVYSIGIDNGIIYLEEV